MLLLLCYCYRCRCRCRCRYRYRYHYHYYYYYYYYYYHYYLVGQEDEGIWEQGLMISNVLLEMTEPVSHKRYQKYIFLSVAQIYLAPPTRNQFHTRKITSIESNG